MILLSLCRPGLKSRFPTSHSVISIHLAKSWLNIPEGRHVTATHFQWNRSVFTKTYQLSTVTLPSGRAISQQHHQQLTNVKQQLAVSRPRLYKQYEMERAEDKLPQEWELIFSQGSLKKKMSVALWFSFIALCAVPFVMATGWWEFKGEEDVIFATVHVSKRTEYLLFVAINILVLRLVYKSVRNIPKRVYFNDSKDRYLAVISGYCPWKTKRIEFKSTDVSDLAYKKLPIKFRPWRDNEYKVHNMILTFPDGCFRSGHDKYWMLRHMDIPKGMRK